MSHTLITGTIFIPSWVTSGPSIIGDTTLNSNTITNVVDINSIVEGLIISGTDIPSGSVVTSVNIGSNSFEIDNLATGNNVGITINTITPDGVFYCENTQYSEVNGFTTAYDVSEGFQIVNNALDSSTFNPLSGIFNLFVITKVTNVSSSSTLSFFVKFDEDGLYSSLNRTPQDAVVNAISEQSEFKTYQWVVSPSIYPGLQPGSSEAQYNLDTSEITDYVPIIKHNGVEYEGAFYIEFTGSGITGVSSTTGRFKTVTIDVSGGGTGGVAGTSGSSGESGTSGSSGETGTSGSSGESGATGTSGSSGENGTSGSSGEAGTSGSSGFSGASVTGATLTNTILELQNSDNTTVQVEFDPSTASQSKEGVTTHGFLFLDETAFTGDTFNNVFTTSAITDNIQVYYLDNSQLTAKLTYVVLDIGNFTTVSQNKVLVLPQLTGSFESKVIKFIMKRNELDDNRDVMIGSKWISGGNSDRIIAANINTKLTNSGYFFPIEPLESVEILYDGYDWLVVNTQKQQYVQATPVNYLLYGTNGTAGSFKNRDINNLL